jgi:microsomal epoxide hydrolase
VSDLPPGADLRPFRVAVPQAEVEDLADRLARTRWPHPSPLDDPADRSRGLPLPVLRELAEHWRTRWDWREHEAQLNAHPQVVTTAHGGDPADAVSLVVPSLPGFGFSGPTPDLGWDAARMARALDELVRRLGHDRYAAHGGDWGAHLCRELARQVPDRLAGVHVTMTVGLAADEPRTDDERAAAERAARYRRELSGYYRLQATRPLSIGAALTDSPVGQLAWIAERFADWTDPDSVLDRLVHRTEFDRGGHFPAMEVPDLLVADLRAFLRRVR